MPAVHASPIRSLLGLQFMLHASHLFPSLEEHCKVPCEPLRTWMKWTQYQLMHMLRFGPVAPSSILRLLTMPYYALHSLFGPRICLPNLLARFTLGVRRVAVARSTASGLRRNHICELTRRMQNSDTWANPQAFLVHPLNIPKASSCCQNDRKH